MTLRQPHTATRRPSRRCLRRSLSAALVALALTSSGCTYSRLAFGAMTAKPAAPIEPGIRMDRLTELGWAFERLSVPELGPIVRVEGIDCTRGRDELLLAGGEKFGSFVRQSSASAGLQLTAQWLQSYPETTGDVLFLDVDGDGRCEVVDQGGGWQETGVYSLEGELLWSFERRRQAVDIMVPAQLDGDPRTVEFLIGMNASGGLYAVDHRGEELWHVEAGNVFQIEVEDLDGDGTAEIVHSDPRASALVRRLDGSLLGPIHFAEDTTFEIVRPRGEAPLWVESKFEEGPDGNVTERLQIRRLDGLLHLELPLPETGHSARLFWVEGEEGDGMWAAVRTLRAVGARSAVMLWNREGELLYHEVLPSSYVSGQTLGLAEGPRFIVGGYDELMVLRPVSAPQS
ncbi:MAG: hypothetical protein AAGK22_03055 [Acidobacteriota bacterium]